MASQIIKEYKHEADGVSIIVAKIDRGFSVTLKDTDCGEYLGTCHIFQTQEAAISKAEKISADF